MTALIVPTPPAPSFARYQTRHNIDPIEGDDEPGRFICSVDSIRVHKTQGGSWRHDAGEIVALFEAWAGTIWPGAERAGAHR